MRQWTKEDVKTIISLWPTETVKAIGLKLGCSEGSVREIVKELKKKGFSMPEKQSQAYRMNAIEEAIAELK